MSKSENISEQLSTRNDVFLTFEPTSDLDSDFPTSVTQGPIMFQSSMINNY